jgi:hypothetical protein
MDATRRLELFRHVIRMGQTRVNKNTFKSKPEGGTNVRLRWLQDEENDLQELQEKTRRQNANKE